jgi:DNA-binding LacI/PurR family transcriptional regulator
MASVNNEQTIERRQRRGAAPDQPKRVTLQDVARMAGVNVSTVSDALKGTGRVSQATRDKVRQIAAERNYVPNLAARALVTGRSGTVAVVCGDLNEYYYANIVYLLENLLTANGYKMMLLRTRREVHDLVTTAEASSVDGVIAVDRYHLVDEFLQTDTKIQTCVFIGTFAPASVDHISIDLSGAVTEALERMLEMGRKRIAYLVTSEPMAIETEVRTQTYLSVMKAAKREPEVINLLTDVQMVRSRLKEYIEANGAPDGLLCQNDETAIYAYRALLDLGLKIPVDVALVGCDGLKHLECFETPISTIVQPMEETCRLAWEFLQKRIADPGCALQQVKLPAYLQVRESLRPSP